MVDNLISKTLAWEADKKQSFLYDGVRLVTILEEYKLTRLQKEEEKKRFRDLKKLQDLQLTERESIYGSKPSPRRASSFRMTSNGYRGNRNGLMTPQLRRNSVASPTMEPMTPRSYSGRQNGYSKEMRRLTTAPLNFVAIPKEDTISFSSVYGSEPGSPLQS
ncbi:65-kDa microtubule-associated protein 6-like [Bidens hawaiensis]|uniref:65-kDa microtubule-associated protein 6-like n=1 Tax=Bidens hawaiensis TaxID=980011 RepID=UPI00404B0233